MSDDPSPPDLIKTSEFPLGELVPEQKIDSSPKPTPVPGPGPSTLFSNSTPLDLTVSHTVEIDEAQILEDSERPFSVRLAPTETVGAIRGFLSARREHPVPLLRRQGLVAVIGLSVLALIVVFSLPQREPTLGSDIEVRADIPEPAAVGSGRNVTGSIDGIGSDGFFTGSKSHSQSHSESGEAAGPDGSTGGDPASAGDDGVALGDTSTTEVEADSDDTTTSVTTLPGFVETSVFVGPGVGTCPDPNDTPPDCGSTTTSASTSPETEPSTSIDPTTTTEASTTSATTSRTTTTRRQTTTEVTTATTSPTTAPTTSPTTSSTTERTTTTRRRTTTTRPTTSTTERPTTTERGTTTSQPSTTRRTTTTRPTTTTTQLTTTSSGEPVEGTGPNPTAVVCLTTTTVAGNTTTTTAGSPPTTDDECPGGVRVTIPGPGPQ